MKEKKKEPREEETTCAIICGDKVYLKVLEESGVNPHERLTIRNHYMVAPKSLHKISKDMNMAKEEVVQVSKKPEGEQKEGRENSGLEEGRKENAQKHLNKGAELVMKC